METMEERLADACMHLSNRIAKAVSIAKEYGDIGGGHHKMWVIDQMVRALLTPEEYDKFRSEMLEVVHDEEEGTFTYDRWSEGVPP